MINYEKIKLGKGLTKNQKRLREIHLQHKLNLEGKELEEKTTLHGHRVKIWKDDIGVTCSRTLGHTFLVYDDKQKENIKLYVETRAVKNWKWHYTKYLDDVYVILGRKNITRHRYKEDECYNYHYNCLILYDNNSVLRNIEPEINHRKKEGGISLYKEFEGGL